VLLSAGVRSWRVGHRIRYFAPCPGGEPRLLQERRADTAADADAEYYVQRLVTVYCQQFAQAFRREDFVRIFGLPADSVSRRGTRDRSRSGAVRPIAEAVL